MKKYSHKVVVTNQKAAWAFTDWLDDEIVKLCWNASQSVSNSEHRRPSIDEFRELMYEKADIGGVRDSIIEAMQDVMDCELVFDYPC